MSIKHVVVLMFENRSYDNVLGWLYHASNPAPYNTPPVGQAGLDGLSGCESNPDPRPGGDKICVANQTAATQIGGAGSSYASTAVPLIDPGEPFNDMAQQILGLASVPKTAPYAGYPPANTAALTQGYTLNYAQLSGITHPDTPVPADNIPDVMNYLTPTQMPVTAFLANNYAVCDQWFASAPTQTYTNRAFALCAAPGVHRSGKFSLIDDFQYVVEGLLPVEDRIFPIPSVLTQLDAVLGNSNNSSPSWKVYFQDYSIAVSTVPQVAAAAASTNNINLATFDDADWGAQCPAQLCSTTTSFVADLAAGNLPPLSFIEPRYFDSCAPSGLPSACNHPGRGNYPGSLFGAKTPIDAATGEVFLMQVYNLLRTSSLWQETLLIVTYDEHGGLFDHVPPPVATPPGRGIPAASDTWGDAAADGFNYTVYGGRVPAIIVSPWIEAGSTVRAQNAQGQPRPFDHSSIVRTVWDLFNLSNVTRSSLTDRDAGAPSLQAALLDSATNTTGTFTGPIVAGAGALAFKHGFDPLDTPSAQSILASAGPGTALSVSVSQPEGQTWLSALASSSVSSLITVITVNVDVSGLRDGTYTGQVVITGDAPNSPVEIPVSLTVATLQTLA